MGALPPIVQQALAPKFLERVQAWVQVAEVHATEELTRNWVVSTSSLSDEWMPEILHRLEFIKIVQEALHSPHAAPSVLSWHHQPGIDSDLHTGRHQEAMALHPHRASLRPRNRWDEAYTNRQLYQFLDYCEGSRTRPLRSNIRSEG